MTDRLTQGKIRILCVGPSAVSYRDLLAGFPVEISVAEEMTEGIGAARRTDPDVIICSAHLPGGTGEAFLRKVREDDFFGGSGFALVSPGTGETDAHLSGGPDVVWDGSETSGRLFREIRLLARLRGDGEALARSRERLDAAAILVRKQKAALKKMKRAALNDRTMLQNTLRQVTLMNAERDRLREEATLLSRVNRGNREGIMTLISSLIEAKPGCPRGHGANVAKIALFMARDLGLDASETGNIERAARLHEAGKLFIPDALLRKSPDEYTPVEEERMDAHPLKAETLLMGFTGFKAEASIVRHLHERFEGTGVPDGLKKDRIPLGARIIALADGYEEIASADSSPNLGEIFSRIEARVGSRYDPKLMPALHRYAAAHPPGDTERCIELSMFELKPGYVLASGIYTALGAKLLPVNTVLTEAAIERIARYNKIDPLDEKVFVKGTVQ